jgi:hypothetical protein
MHVAMISEPAAHEKVLLNRAELCALLGITLDYFYHNHRKLRSSGLPAPRFGRGKGAKWSYEEVLDWIRHGRQRAEPERRGQYRSPMARRRAERNRKSRN